VLPSYVVAYDSACPAFYTSVIGDRDPILLPLVDIGRADSNTYKVEWAFQAHLWAWRGPIEKAVMVPPSFSFSRIASSRAFRQKWVTMDGTPSRIRFNVMGSKRISVASGMCLTQTMMCKPPQPILGYCQIIQIGLRLSREFSPLERVNCPFSVSRKEMTQKMDSRSTIQCLGRGIQELFQPSPLAAGPR